jgi:hypothetical protein
VDTSNSANYSGATAAVTINTDLSVAVEESVRCITDPALFCRSSCDTDGDPSVGVIGCDSLWGKIGNLHHIAVDAQIQTDE